MAEYLRDQAHHLGFKEQMKAQFDKPIGQSEAGKFHWLHRVFPYLKITTNYDSLIEDNRPDHFNHTDVVTYGYQHEKMEQLFTSRFETQSLVKLHGDFRDPDSIGQIRLSPKFVCPQGFAPTTCFRVFEQTSGKTQKTRCAFIHHSPMAVLVI